MNIVKVSNLRSDARQLGYEFADVTVQSGVLLWRKSEVRQIYKPPHSEFWRWADSGDFTPNLVVERLVDAAKAREVRP